MREQAESRNSSTLLALTALVYLILREPSWPGELAGLGEFEADSCASGGGGSLPSGCLGQSCGIVISVSGKRHYDMALVLANIENIRLKWKESTPIELWFKGEAEAYPPYFRDQVCKLGGVRLRDLSRRSLCTKYYCKMAALEYTAFDQVLLLDSNALLFQAPATFFKKINRPGAAPIYLFRDYNACFESLGRGYTKFGLGVDPNRFCELTYGQEIDSSCVVFDRLRAAAALADSVVMRHRWLVGFLTLGDKDTWLLSAIRTSTHATVHQSGPSFFVYQGLPLEGHLHLEDGLPLYGNIQMLNACAMANSGLKYLRMTSTNATVQSVAPACEGQLHPHLLSQTARVDTTITTLLESACHVTKRYGEAIGTSASDSRVCKFRCGDRDLNPDLYSC